jgi:tetratricopeptide (TPR) repeat protein
VDLETAAGSQLGSDIGLSTVHVPRSFRFGLSPLVRERPAVRFFLEDTEDPENVLSEIDPGRAIFLGWLVGWTQMQRGDLHTALRIWRQYSPNAAFRLANLATDYIDNDDWESAQPLAYLAEELSSDPSIEKAPLYNRMCTRAVNESRATDALTWCAKLMSISSSQGAQIMMGRAYLGAGQFDLAQDFFEVALANDPDWLRGYNYLAEACAGVEDWEGTVAALERGARLGPLDESTSLLLAKAWLKLSMQKQAVKLLNALLAGTSNPSVAEEACHLAMEFQIDVGCGRVP